MTAASGSAPRAPQQDRSRATQLHLLETAVECLAERGYAATTVSVVAERAGVSRGAAQHHFPTREVLFMAAVDHMAARRHEELELRAEELPPFPERTYAVLELVGGLYIGPLFRAALQVWVAASADATLRAKVIPLEARFGRDIYATTVRLLELDDSRPGVRTSVAATLDMLRGLALADILTDDSRRRGSVLRQWADTLNQTLVPRGPGH